MGSVSRMKPVGPWGRGQARGWSKEGRWADLSPTEIHRTWGRHTPGLWEGLEFSSRQDSNDRRVWGHQAAILGKTVPTLAWRGGYQGRLPGGGKG